MSKLRVIGACALLLTGVVHGANTLSITDIAKALCDVDCYRAEATYEVLLASLAEPVSYAVTLQSAAAAADDTLSPCRYIIDWSMPSPSGTTDGFCAYVDAGNHYRYRKGNRIQEYHTEASMLPFAPGGDTHKGVQYQAQFAELLPQFIGVKLEAMAADSTYMYAIDTNARYNGIQAVILKGVRRIGGATCAEYTYVFDSATLLPIAIELENNPGQIGEQSIVVKYTGSTTPSACSLTTDSLIGSHAEAFENYRESAFSLERLSGKELPQISARTLDGKRYYHHRGDALNAPTIITFVDASVATTPQVIREIRRGVNELPMRTDIVWAFVNHRQEDIADLMGQISGVHGGYEFNEVVLVDARAAARECGVGAITPVIIFVDNSGVVKNYVQGFNQDLASIVIEMSLSK